MIRAVTFTRAARKEFLEAVSRYEVQRPNLGQEFLAEIERCVQLAAEQPQLCAVVHKDVRQLTARRFPYSIYFRVVASRIVVLAVFHGRRNPAAWRRRV